ncbi:lipid asymmetry maintenance protein MlaB [[Erwinia] mediterraneensis]|uniref:lipid asymmetry maintenance protein MlaB n=1 Tax=[Erwinia] mediterraneensis TaxID=2161819 RepID=UPI0010318701|nr:lipid asymmetry maintenance protein MlaB [[Erwinia] mediterraneensis]
MSEPLRWQLQENRLHLSGMLDRDTLQPLWEQRESVMAQADIIDVSALDRVDSAGLALLVHLLEMARRQGKAPCFSGITDKLLSLITLYNLQQIIVSADKNA